jgi:uncharacterized protein (DUF885 family)
MKKIASLAMLTLAFLLPAFSQGFELYEPISRFQADRAALERKYTLRESPEYLDRMDRLYADWLEYLDGLEYPALSPDAQIDYLLFRNFLNKALFFNSLNREDYERVAFVTDFADGLYQFIRERRRGTTVDGPAEATLFHEAAGQFRQAADNLEGLKRFSSWMDADKAAAVVRDLRENLAEAHGFYHGYHPDYTWWALAPYEQLERELLRYEKLLAEHYVTDSSRDDGSGIIGRPEGRHALIHRLQYEFIPYTPEELIEVGRKELAWCRDEMIAAAREMGFGDDWRAALEHVKRQYVPAGEQPEMINRLAEEAIAFLEDHDLLSIPDLARETWRMQMMSPEMQLVNPFFLGGEAIRISYPTNTMEHDAKMMSLRGNNPHFCMATVHHELIAGHHLQGFVNQRNKPYRRILGTPFWTEGWALYWEFLLYEKGLPPTPEDRMGFLFWRKHRAARIIFSLNFHLEQMSPQECIDFLVSEVGHERANAEAEVRRSFMGRYDPLYQLAYMIGGFQFQGLRAELVDNGDMSLKEFHDAVLRQNSIPVELLRAVLSGKSLPEDYTTTWRFLD